MIDGIVNSAAEKVPGVIGVLTAKDIPGREPAWQV